MRLRNGTETLILVELFAHWWVAVRAAGSGAFAGLTSDIPGGRSTVAWVASPGVGPLSDQEEAGATRTARPWILPHHHKFSTC